MSDIPKYCHFCGSSFLTCDGEIDDSSFKIGEVNYEFLCVFYYVRCISCGARGGYSYSIDDAFSFWERAQPRNIE